MSGTVSKSSHTSAVAFCLRLQPPPSVLGHGGIAEAPASPQSYFKYFLFFFLLTDCLIPNKGNNRKSHNAVRNRQDFVSTPQLPPPVISADKSLQISLGEEGARPLSCPKPTVLPAAGEGSGGHTLEQGMCCPSRNPRATGEPGHRQAGKTIGS